MLWFACQSINVSIYHGRLYATRRLPAKQRAHLNVKRSSVSAQELVTEILVKEKSLKNKLQVCN